jgi:citrate lyase subunit beta/citryl-CoA lyase
MDELAIGPRVAQFVAGDTRAHLDKTVDPQAACDMWIVNWEAAITDKALARTTTRAFLEGSARSMRGERVVRPNPLRGGEGAADLDEIRSWPGGWIDGVLLPLVESPADVAGAASAVPAAVAPRLHVLIETPQAALEAPAIAAALRSTGRAGGLFAGLADFTSAMGVWETADEPERNFAWFLGAIVVAARAHGLYAIGPVPPGIDQDVAEWAATWRRMGYSGVMTVHPAQSARALEAFVPGPERLRQALERLEALERSGGAAVRLGSRVVELPMCVPDLVVVRYAVQAGVADPGQYERFRGLFRCVAPGIREPRA